MPKYNVPDDGDGVHHSARGTDDARNAPVTPRRPGPEPITKTQRWLDLIALLLGRQIPMAVEEIMERVPAYARGWSGDGTARASVRRMFERDKDELRAMGIPLETVDYAINSGRETLEGYRISRRDLYLPYLRLIASGIEEREGSRSAGSRGIAEVEIAPAEAQAALDALHRVAEMPAFPFTEDARAALQKLTFDLDPATFVEAPVRWVDPPGTEEILGTLRVISDALLARKRVRFRYRGIHRGAATDRNVAPYGLFFQRDWYLVGEDATRGAIRVFRVARIESPEANRSAPRTPDYTVPADFHLAAYLDRKAWELGEADEVLTARVRFPFPASVWAERNGEGELVETGADGSAVRRFRVAQTEPFLRWILGRDGDAELLDPPELVAELRALAREVAALYAEVQGG